ncbi:hypothetical protein [Neisseria bacilliformis]|uniref:hypothetical protein n=1 Tax=Neisseria bacilliformis TaxID=267212 RepID=UPI00128CA0D6|nr:hypothetical protein [Neisseria bacilliformis]
MRLTPYLSGRGRLKNTICFQTAFSPSAHAESDVGCVAPRRRTRFPLFKGRLKILKPDFQTAS